MDVRPPQRALPRPGKAATAGRWRRALGAKCCAYATIRQNDDAGPALRIYNPSITMRLFAHAQTALHARNGWTIATVVIWIEGIRS